MDLYAKAIRSVANLQAIYSSYILLLILDLYCSKFQLMCLCRRNSMAITADFTANLEYWGGVMMRTPFVSLSSVNSLLSRN